MKKKTVVCICLIAAAAAAAAAFAVPSGAFAKRAPVMAAFYVSPSGSDDGTGAEHDPFATVERARDEVRKLNADMTGDIVVHIAAGEYRLANTLELDGRDGATNGYAIRYVGEKGAVLCDAGGVYTLSKQSDSEIRGNYIHDITLPEGADYATSGIYMDEQTAGFTVKDNVIYHAWGVGRNANGENDYRENRIYIDKKWDPRTWGIMLGAGRKQFYGFFAKTHFG